MQNAATDPDCTAKSQDDDIPLRLEALNLFQAMKHYQNLLRNITQDVLGQAIISGPNILLEST